MALERTYNIPLRREWLRAPKYRRAKRAVHAVQNFLKKHMKSEDVKIGKYLNEAIWARGIRSPPHHVEVKVTKDDKNIVFAELVGAPVEVKEEVKKAPEVKEEKKVAQPGVKKEIPAKAEPEVAPEPAKVEPKHVEKQKVKPTEKPKTAKPAPKKEAKKAKPTKGAVKKGKK